jgi:hypothetical protein
MSSNVFFYENGQGQIVDEHGNEAMNCEEVLDQFQLQNLTSLSKYREVQVPPLLDENDPEVENKITVIQKKSKI